MAGQSAVLVTPQEVVDGASVRVSTQGGPIRLVDARPPTNWTVADVEDALERHKARSGPLVAFVAASVSEQWARIRSELNRIAGGQASDRVMASAYYAEQANYAVALQRTRVEAAVGEDAKNADSAVRDFTGLTAVAAARLNEAFDLAEREAKAGHDRVAGPNGLLARLGHQVPGSSMTLGGGQASVPSQTPGAVGSGAPLSLNCAPPGPPEPGGTK